MTESIVSTEFRLPIWAVVTPAISPTGFPLNIQRNEIGKSPEVTRHCTLAESPKFDGSSPKWNGATFGGTIFMVLVSELVGFDETNRTKYYFTKKKKVTNFN